MQGFIQKEWYVYGKKAPFNEYAAKLGIDPVTVRIMRNRDIVSLEEMQRFLGGSVKDLHPAGLLPNVGKAAEMIISSARNGERILVVGDYDVDGICATYILCDGLKRIGANVSHVIPDRIKDGYGINRSIVEMAHEEGTDLILTCDNGIAAIEALGTAKDYGMKVIVTDHHDIRTDGDGNEQLPEADVIVSAKLKESEYPEKEICGAVTAWKLLGVIFDKCGIGSGEWEKYLEFAALSTICDVMKLTGENRIIVREGLDLINRSPRNEGLKALINITNASGERINCFKVGFVLGPCINAGGRLETAEMALRLFMSENEGEALDRALGLKELNGGRKYLTQKGAEDAFSLVESEHMDDRVLVLYLPSLHESMAGIVASRVKERYGKPTLVITDSSTEATDENGRPHRVLKGSGRSIDSYNMFENIRKADSLLFKYGGHPMAAGFSLYEENLGPLREKLNSECSLTEEDFRQKVWIDAPMPMSYVSMRLVEELSMLEPFGNGNEKPKFAEKGVRVANMKVLGKNRNVLRMDLISSEGQCFHGIMFGEADEIKKELEQKHQVSIIYYPQINEYNGQKTLQFQIEDFK